MTYYVFGGMLSLNQSINQLVHLLNVEWCQEGCQPSDQVYRLSSTLTVINCDGTMCVYRYVFAVHRSIQSARLVSRWRVMESRRSDSSWRLPGHSLTPVALRSRCLLSGLFALCSAFKVDSLFSSYVLTGITCRPVWRGGSLNPSLKCAQLVSETSYRWQGLQCGSSAGHVEHVFVFHLICNFVQDGPEKRPVFESF